MKPTHPLLTGFVQEIKPKATKKDIVLPKRTMKILKDIVSHTRHDLKMYEELEFEKMSERVFGISALFSGESGTGKTMAAEVIANNLKLCLYRIDLSTVVSKYVGETEKNLQRVFDAAESGGAVLFFDEADALFGKRSEVKDDNDRYNKR
jgi:SpoVK/Ycf46/Vps4 family AAA+-type ATPase